MKRTPFVISLLLVTTGVALIGFDIYHLVHFGCCFNDVLAITENGQTVDWPTGETPLYAYFNPWMYGIGYCLTGAAVFFWHRSRLLQHLFRV